MDIQDIYDLLKNPSQKFTVKNAEFYLPSELDNFEVIEVNNTEHGECAEHGEFTLKIHVATFELVDKGSHESFTWNQDLDAPFLLKAYYQMNDLRENKINLEELTLGICYTTDWVLKTSAPIQENDNNGGYWVVPIQSARDPMVGWGP